MDRIEDFQAFVAIVEKGSLTAAARLLDRSLQAVSRSLAALERELGVELIRRTTRRLSTTEAGQGFYHRIKTALDEIDEAKREATQRQSEASGLLRISGSNAFSPIYLVPAVAAFMERYPDVEIELETSDGYVDLAEGGFDLAVRIGEMPDSSLQARRLASLRRVVFGSPGYFAKMGRPKRPDDLAQHQCIIRTASRDGNRWPFTIAGRLKAVKIGGRFRTSSAVAANEAATQGLGIANAPLWQVRDLVDAGRLELILTRFEPSPVPMHAVWTATKLPAAKTRLFIDFLATRMKEERW